MFSRISSLTAECFCRFSGQCFHEKVDELIKFVKYILLSLSKDGQGRAVVWCDCTSVFEHHLFKKACS